MSREPIRTGCQIYIEEEFEPDYWGYLPAHLPRITSLSTTVDGAVTVHCDHLVVATTQ